MKNIFFVKYVTISLTILALVACASKKPVELSAQQLYQEAKASDEDANYTKSIEYYEKLEAVAQGTNLAQQAQLNKAFAYYKNNDKELALSTLSRFLQLHPDSPATDYALYLMGLVYFNDSKGTLGFLSSTSLADRDPYANKQSFAAFNQLITTYPNSKYSPDARERMSYLINSLALNEINTARFYYQRQAYVAAINRCKNAIENYQGAQSLEEALYIMAQSYKQLKLDDGYQNTMNVLKHNFPDSQYLSMHGELIAKPTKWWKFWQ